MLFNQIMKKLKKLHMNFLVWAFWESVFSKVVLALASCDGRPSKKQVARRFRYGGLLSCGIVSAASQNSCKSCFGKKDGICVKICFSLISIFIDKVEIILEQR
jgi:hypothetical protein